MLRPIKLEHEGATKTFACVHWRNFPPQAALVAKFEKITLTDYWKSGRIKTGDYEQAKTWERLCNKFAMDDKCLECPRVRFVEIREFLPCLVSLDGTVCVPQVDMATVESRSRRGTVDLRLKDV